MKLIYWNTKGFIDFEVYEDLLIKYSPDILFTSETDSSFLTSHKASFNKIGYNLIDNPGCERIKILSHKDCNCELGIQNKFYTCIIIDDINVISVHFPSQMYHHMDALKYNLRKFRNKIDDEIGESSDKPILIIGDVNVNPYEPAMINFDGFMATNSIKSRKRIKSIDDEVREPYYNPTWRLYADNIFPGTKKYPRPSGFSHDIIEFHFLDQVLLSEKLKNNIESDKISVVTKTDKFDLLNEKYNKVNFSDHLPLFYQLKMK
jgi:exonuclease III